jgi:hypothetical protein
MNEPSTPQEWQEAVDAARGAIGLNAAHQYGLILMEMSINVARCEDILERGAALGYQPAADSIERFAIEVTARRE